MKLKTVLNTISIIINIFVVFYIRLKNPNLTETELFLTFWPLYLLMVISILLVLASSKD